MDAIRDVAATMRLEEEDILARRAVASDRSYRIAVATQLLTGAVALCIMERCSSVRRVVISGLKVEKLVL